MDPVHGQERIRRRELNGCEEGRGRKKMRKWKVGWRKIDSYDSDDCLARAWMRTAAAVSSQSGTPPGGGFSGSGGPGGGNFFGAVSRGGGGGFSGASRQRSAARGVNMVQCYRLMSKSVAIVSFTAPMVDPIKICATIVALKTHSAYIVADVSLCEDYLHRRKISVEFPDQQTVEPSYDHMKTRNGILGIHCCLCAPDRFDSNQVMQAQVSEDAVIPSQKVFIYDGIGDTVTEGFTTAIYQEQFDVTNIASPCVSSSEPVVDSNGRVIGMCRWFEHHVTARSIRSISEEIEKSFSRCFTSRAFKLLSVILITSFEDRPE